MFFNNFTPSWLFKKLDPNMLSHYQLPPRYHLKLHRRYVQSEVLMRAASPPPPPSQSPTRTWQKAAAELSWARQGWRRLGRAGQGRVWSTGAEVQQSRTTVLRALPLSQRLVAHSPRSKSPIAPSPCSCVVLFWSPLLLGTAVTSRSIRFWIIAKLSTFGWFTGA